MNKPQKIYLALAGLLFSVLPSVAREAFKPAVITLKNGEVINCLAQMPENKDKSVIMKKDVNSNKLVIPSDSIFSVETTNGGNIHSLAYNIPYVTASELLDGDTLKLSTRVKAKKQRGHMMGDKWLYLYSNGYLQYFRLQYQRQEPKGPPTLIVNRYVKRQDKSYALSLLSQEGTGTGLKTKAKKALAAYLHDCPEVVRKINAKDRILEEDLQDLIDEFNSLMASKPITEDD